MHFIIGEKFFLVFFYFRTMHFVLCLGITNKCFNSYQFIISLSCSYMYRHLCAILRELICTFCDTCQCGFWLIKYGVVCACVCVYYVAACCVSMSMLQSTRQHRQVNMHQAATKYTTCTQRISMDYIQGITLHLLVSFVLRAKGQV
jgi:hypothetical protein